VDVCPSSATFKKPVGFHRPRFNGEKWTEGDPQGKAALIRETVKRQAKERISECIVTTESGLQFNACDASQNRICRAVVRMSDGEACNWVMADKAISLVSREDLAEALRLAGSAYTNMLVGEK